MKKSVILITLIFSVIIMFAQNNSEVNPKLLAKFDAAQISNLKAINPDTIEFLNYYANNSYRIMDYPVEKNPPYQMLTSYDENNNPVEIISMDELGPDFNPFLYNCVSGKSNNNCYKIGKTGKMVMMLSMDHIVLKYRSYKTANNSNK